MLLKSLGWQTGGGLFGYESRSFSDVTKQKVRCMYVLQAWLLRNWQNTSNQQASLQMLSACLAEQSFSWTLSLPFYQRSCESPFWKDDDSEDDLIGQSLWIYQGSKTGLAIFSVETIQVFKGFPLLGYLIPRHGRMCETAASIKEHQ